MIGPEEGAYAFQALLRHDRAYTGYISINGTPWLTALAQRSRFADSRAICAMRWQTSRRSWRDGVLTESFLITHNGLGRRQCSK